MGWFKLKHGPPVDVNGYHFVAGVPVDVTDELILRKLRGRGRSKIVHPGFEEVPTGSVEPPPPSGEDIDAGTFN